MVPKEMADQDRVKIERVGGLGGFGLPGSHLKSRGELSTSELSPADLEALDALFKADSAVGESMPDAFRYRITRKIGANEQTIEVPEDSVPGSIKSCVKDTLD
jgi:hypothetical protein